MRHRKKKIVLDRNASQRRSLVRNLATSLILYERITTTDARARAVRPIVERLVTLGKKNTLPTRRKLLSYLNTKGAAKKVLEVISPRFQQRAGGYLRCTRLGRPRGDGATMVRIEFIA